MRKNRTLLLAGLFFAVLGGFAWVVMPPSPGDPPEPVYEGKPLSYWLQGFSANYPTSPNGSVRPTYQEALSAFHHEGTNAIPSLLRLLRTPDSPLKDKLFPLLQRQRLIHFSYHAPSLAQGAAWPGFQALGADASAAVPQLMQVFEEHDNTMSRQLVPAILAGIGPPAKAAIPLLIRATTDPDAYVRNNSVYALGQIDGEPAQIVPVLTKSLEDPFDSTRANAAKALAKFGTNARPAIPALLKLLAQEHTNPAVGSNPLGVPANLMCIWGPNPPNANKPGRGGLRMGSDVIGPATAALKAIDPEAAAKADEK